MKNKKLKKLLEQLSHTELKKYDYYVAAGCINQTIFNYYHNYKIDYGIKDYDIVYFDNDISYEKEDYIINEISNKLNIDLDIKNEARVHCWYKDKFGIEIKPYKNCEDAISKWGATITCIGVRMEKNKLIVFAPYGLNDIFNQIVRPIGDEFKKESYIERANRWVKKWPNLKIIPWHENN